MEIHLKVRIKFDPNYKVNNTYHLQNFFLTKLLSFSIDIIILKNQVFNKGKFGEGIVILQ